MAPRIVACDIGTMFFQTAEYGEDGQIHFKEIRNAFVELEASEDIEQILHQNKWQYVSDQKHYFVIGDDALRVARIFPGKIELRRPMQDGVLNKDEDKKMLIVAKMIESLIGKAPDDKSVVCTCVSSDSVDGSMDNIFHKARLEAFLSRLGWKVKVIEEGHAVILSERPVLVEKDGTEVPYSGIGISAGAGRVNCVLAYRGLPIIGMSTTHAGDWVDRKVAEQTNTPISQVINIKETKLDFTNIDYNDDILFCLDAYYTSMVEFVFKKFAEKFAKVKSQFEVPIEIVVAGGTSMPNGFGKKIKSVISTLELPFEIKNIRRAANPRNAVVTGCLAQAVITQKKLISSS
jgi:hypothetical protein